MDRSKKLTIRALCYMMCCVSIQQFCVAGRDSYPGPPPEFFRLHGHSKALTIAPGDVLSVRFHYNPELNKTVRVREDGKISLDLFQGIAVAGQTPEQLQQLLVELYSHEFTKPEVTVDVDTRANSEVYVTGEVLQPGAKEVHAGMTVAMVLAMSQVSQKTAGIKSVFLIRDSNEDKEDKYVVYKLDASFPSGTARGIQVAPGDILFVPRNRIAKADDFVDQFIRQLLPGTPSANLSVVYTPGNPILTNSTNPTSVH